MDVINGLISHLKADTALSAFFVSHYDRAPKHLLGYKKSPNANDLPLLCYVPVKSQVKQRTPSARVIAIVLFINDDRYLNSEGVLLDVGAVAASDTLLFSGAVRSEQAQDLIVKSLMGLSLPDGSIIGIDFTINTDMTLGFPFFQTEIAFEVKNIFNF
jgi:hypothetical protein